MQKVISNSEEDYLEAILALSNGKGGVRVTDIANTLNLSKPSVNKAIKNLKERGLVTHESYGPVYLTINGECIAKNVETRHIILRRFLKDILGVEEQKAEDEACAIEHSISIDTIEKLSTFLDKLEKKKGLL
ncbi:MAG: metal-dependent transcriptional regulator [Defluviitaleaceae bacterium]|nr:metal-dependent transcriptional regulator [Defluviitaleaceae bacterium]